MLTTNQLSYLFSGLYVTISVSMITIFLSLLFGIALGTIRFINIPIVSTWLGLIIDTIRNLPLLLIIFFTYFALPQIGVRIPIFWASVTSMTIFESCMISEIIRAGLIGVPKGLAEAGYSSGFSRWQVLSIIQLPLALRSMVPAMMSQLVALIKDTSLATIITLPELMHHAKVVYNQETTVIIPVFIVVSLMYFVICYTISYISKRLEIKNN